MARGSATAAPPKDLSAPAGKPATAAGKLHFSAAGFRDRLHAWYREHARILPWRGVDDPYAIWLSEIMLQQTRVATVHERYGDFLERFPTLRDLADADETEVLALWSGLGYYRRARLLHRGAQFVIRELKGKLPRSAAELRTLPGVGDYTAAAIASIAFGQSVAVIDGNVERVLLRVLGMPEEKSAAARAELARVAQFLMPPAARRPSRNVNPPGEHNQAMMELGATICLPRGPLCLQCPLVDICKTRGEHVTLRREVRQSRIAAHLLTLRKRGILTEILLERRPQSGSLMPGMMELPPLPLEIVAAREPVLRLRHAITNTNYYVQIFAESAPGIEPTAGDEHDQEIVFSLDGARLNSDGSRQNPEDLTQNPTRPWLVPAGTRLMQPRSRLQPPKWMDADDPGQEDEAVFVASSLDLAAARGFAHSLLGNLPLEGKDLEWVSTARLVQHPLTGLTRKVLQRLGVMPMPRLQIG